MIIKTEPLSMTETIEILKKTKTESPEFVGFSHKFPLIKSEKAKELREKFEELKMLKLDPEHITKIIELAPKNSVDLNKIFIDVGLDENESEKILEIIKKYK